MTGRPRVLTISHRNRVRLLPLPPSGQLSIGRDDENDVRLSGDALVSRRHALLHVGEDLLVEDLGSQNGTRVLGDHAHGEPGAPTASSSDRLRPRVPTRLPDGATVQLGGTLLSIVEAAAPAPAVEGDVVVVDPRMRHLHALLARAAGRDINVLLLGETGVGKDVFARRIHALSPRAKGPFVGINCGALSEPLLESELFGHVRGAFTGAHAAKPGLFEAAAGGVTFLDEVGELPPSLQVKLLRVLEERTVLRVGAVRPTPIDVRIVAATNRDLDRAVAAGHFRSDLYYRLDGISFVIPPLRERAAEILPLAALWLRRLSEKEGRAEVPALDPEAAELLAAHAWPGNVRELRNVVERALVLCEGPTVRPEHIVFAPAMMAQAPGPRHDVAADEPHQAPPGAAPPPAGVSLPPAGAAPRPAGEATGAFAPVASALAAGPDVGEGSASPALLADPPAPLSPEVLRSRADELERERLRAALDECAGNQTRAAARLGLSRRALIRRIERFQLGRPKQRLEDK